LCSLLLAAALTAPATPLRPALADMRDRALCRPPGLAPAPPSPAVAPLLAAHLPPDFPVDRYLTAAELNSLLITWADRFPDLVQIEEIGRSWQDRPILALRIGSHLRGDPDQRPALYLDAQHHAQEAITPYALLHFIWSLLTRYGYDPAITFLLDTRAVYAIPTVNPDGNDLFIARDQRQRASARPVDDDQDGVADEDGAEAFGFGAYAQYTAEFTAQWLADHPGDPFVKDWRSALTGPLQPAGRASPDGARITPRDDDRDGRVDEDGPGGVDLNRNYAAGWTASQPSGGQRVNYSGVAPFSEPETRAVRDFVLAHPNIVLAATLHSGSDIILYPWGASRRLPLPDLAWYATVAAKGAQLTARHDAATQVASAGYGLYRGGGSAMDWLHTQGILAWTPEIYTGSTISYSVNLAASDHATGRFPVQSADGLLFAPQPDAMLSAVSRWSPWLLYLLSALPHLTVHASELTGDRLEIGLRNDGLIPMTVEARLDGRPLGTPWQVRAGLHAHTLTLPPPVSPTLISLHARPALHVPTRHVQTLDLEPDPAAPDLAAHFGGWAPSAPIPTQALVAWHALCRRLDGLVGEWRLPRINPLEGD
jgi:hypothetical protein